MSFLGALATFALGLASGAAYFGGLWWTLARLPRWRRPGWVLAASFAVRGPLLLVLLALLAREGVVPLLLALAGFLVARVVLAAWLRPAPAPPAGGPAAERDPLGGGP